MTARTTRRTAATSRIAAVCAIAVAGTMLLTACGDQTKSDDTKKSTGSSKSAAPLANLLPADIKAKGKIMVGSDIAYAPVESTDASGKTVGIDPDIAEALGKQLGVTFEFQNGKFADLIAGLAAKRYDIAMSAMTDTKDRQNGIDGDTKKKVGAGVDFVDYFTAGVSIYTNKGADNGIKTWDDLCGKSIGVQTATFSQDLAKAQAKKCTAAGKKTVKIEDFPTNPEAETRMRSKGVDAVSADFPIAAYSVKHSGDGKYFEIVGDQVEAGPYGIALAKGNDKLRDAIQAALQAIIKNGEYDKIIAKWGVEAGANHDAKINGGS
ncbi:MULTISPECIES: ABC transporter substrate-binding protein [Streptomyces]|jgi:polar amino acid transport system substrate-binding protein|uniref:ABC transporter substrate-binding protein n=1 Tax=unclassified Streptomyces TaxID=2593676 RepID=UPI0004CC1D61|nr:MULTISPECIES: ABC transporter substrate-binding protein [unclassified Streptomyces]MDX2732525.1 ABC transporter substrate-binding protein [Streptomyces sp. PA03-2a]MDX3765742.1 ABC transporter substrate-binding protein [Streptomyces sp. AK08-01B]MDX3816085.1 ABC transporter substrate-binding protein [Streptomyces sp. AK08-01A]WSQ27410.1 ABC transporter substrate-binding protein [Streptomyces sp. NBC_01230]SCY51056.1 polar amino acid transport system substrate-binding protein [Streptomyces s